MAEPTVLVPSAGEARTVLVVVHTDRAGPDPVPGGPDAFSLFVARSSALGLLAEPGETSAGTSTGTSGGVWGMNDAGTGLPGQAAGSGPGAWFQVDLVASRESNAPLPTQALLSCAADVLAKLQFRGLRGVELLLPLQGSAPEPDARTTLARLLQDGGWFAGAPEPARTEVFITLDVAGPAHLRSAGVALGQWMAEVRQAIAVLKLDAITATAASASGSSVPAHLWAESPAHRLAFRAALVEWSLDAVGWLAAFVAEAAVHGGLSGQAALTVTRADP